MLRAILKLLLITAATVTVVSIPLLMWGYNYITRDLPQIQSVKDYRPPATTTVHATDGTLIAEFYEERRYPTKLSEIPPIVRNAFLAAEDANFYSHPGIDFISILRAAFKNISSGQGKQGASTITQQVVKNLLLTPERTLRRKLKEAILSYRLEKKLTKDEILEIYLNQIFFGNTAHGIKAAAKIYFNKELNQITLGEAAMLAGLPKAPSKFSPTKNPVRAASRQKYVLTQMVKAGFIAERLAKAAEKEQLTVYLPVNEAFLKAKYFGTEVKRDLIKILGSEGEVLNGGYKVETVLDLKSYQLAEKALRVGLREVDKRRGWRGVIKETPPAERTAVIQTLARKNNTAGSLESLLPGEPYQALITSVNQKDKRITINLGAKEEPNLSLQQSRWAERYLDKKGSSRNISLLQHLLAGHLIEVSYINEGDRRIWQIDQTPEIEGALVLINPFTGEVPVVVGGYNFERSSFNRATQALRQPGSSFKPIVYLTAIDQYNFTPATIVDDSPKSLQVGDEIWAPGNYDGKYLGLMTLRTALEKSRNLVSVDIVARTGVTSIIEYAKKLGITSPIGRNPSISLGSSEVTLLELTRAYGVFAAQGMLFDNSFINKIYDRDGKLVFDNSLQKLQHGKRAISQQSAFLMTNMMRGVVDRGTATVLKALERPVAGKTGTSNDHMDTWFIGYTPEWVAGVWVGFDLKKKIGSHEAGGKTAAPIFLNFMKAFLAEQDRIRLIEATEESKRDAEELGIDFVPTENIQPADFVIPDKIQPYWINSNSGLQTPENEPGAFLEYFLEGTEPGWPTQDEAIQDKDINENTSGL